MKAMITQGATTTHGGVVSEVFDKFSIDGKKIHLDGMTHYCPLCKKTVSAIGTDNTKIVMGKKMVFEGDKTSCGATFIGNQTLSFSTTGSAALGMDLINSLILNKESHEFAERFLLQSEVTNEPVRFGQYEVYKNSQLILTGTTDENGMTQLITGTDGEKLEIRIVGDHNE